MLLLTIFYIYMILAINIVIVQLGARRGNLTIIYINNIYHDYIHVIERNTRAYYIIYVIFQRNVMRSNLLTNMHIS